MKFKAEVMKLNEKNENDRIYDEKCAKVILDKLSDNLFIDIQLNDKDVPYKIDPSTIIGQALQGTIIDNKLIIEGVFNDNIDKTLLENNYLTPCGIGEINEKGILYNYEITKLCVTQTSAFNSPCIQILD